MESIEHKIGILRVISDFEPFLLTWLAYKSEADKIRHFTNSSTKDLHL
jgi:hypothetical protein